METIVRDSLRGSKKGSVFFGAEVYVSFLPQVHIIAEIELSSYIYRVHRQK